jgi:carboxyl-terminal processing protease
MAVAFMRGPAGVIVDGIGVPPDDEVPLTAAAVSAGRDPAIARAVRDLRK